MKKIKTVWVTGGERSLGKTIVQTLACREDQSEEFKVESLSRPEWDLSMPSSQLREQFKKKIRNEGSPDVMVHNSGTMYMEWLENQDLSKFDELMQVNMMSRYVMNQVLYQAHLENGEKPIRIIHIISMAHRFPLRQCPAYCASKAADAAVVKQLAKECTGLHPKFLIFGVSPGGIEGTPMIDQAIQRLQETRGMTKEQAEKYNVQSPYGRNCTQREVANVVLFAATDAPAYMSGHNFELAGGALCLSRNQSLVPKLFKIFVSSRMIRI